MTRNLITIAVLALTAATATAQTTWQAGPYAYDGAGNIKSIGSGEQFVYDRLGRLRSGTAGSGRLQEYTYDAYGNILSVITDRATANARRPCVDSATNQIDRAMTDCNLNGVYDDSGNMTSYGSLATFRYDAVDTVTESNVAGVRKVHLYSASDERIASIAVVNNTLSSSSQWTIRDNGGRVLRRFSSTSGVWSWSEDYVYGAGRLLAAEVAGPERTLHFHSDHLGTPRVITGSGGAEIARHTYYPFGEEATDPNQDAEKAKFTGHERDDRNLDYMHARYYVPYAGRFLSVDPGKDWDSHQPQSWNLYTYARDNPINATDPDGRAVFSQGTVVSVKVLHVSISLGANVNYDLTGNSSLTGSLTTGLSTTREGVSVQSAMTYTNVERVEELEGTDVVAGGGVGPAGVEIGFDAQTLRPGSVQLNVDPFALLSGTGGVEGSVGLQKTHEFVNMREVATTVGRKVGETIRDVRETVEDIRDAWNFIRGH